MRYCCSVQRKHSGIHPKNFCPQHTVLNYILGTKSIPYNLFFISANSLWLPCIPHPYNT